MIRVLVADDHAVVRGGPGAAAGHRRRHRAGRYGGERRREALDPWPSAARRGADGPVDAGDRRHRGDPADRSPPTRRPHVVVLTSFSDQTSGSSTRSRPGADRLPAQARRARRAARRASGPLPRATRRSTRRRRGRCSNRGAAVGRLRQLTDREQRCCCSSRRPGQQADRPPARHRRAHGEGPPHQRLPAPRRHRSHAGRAVGPRTPDGRLSGQSSPVLVAISRQELNRPAWTGRPAWTDRRHRRSARPGVVARAALAAAGFGRVRGGGTTPPTVRFRFGRVRVFLGVVRGRSRAGRHRVAPVGGARPRTSCRTDHDGMILDARDRLGDGLRQRLRWNRRLRRQGGGRRRRRGRRRRTGLDRIVGPWVRHTECDGAPKLGNSVSRIAYAVPADPINATAASVATTALLDQEFQFAEPRSVGTSSLGAKQSRGAATHRHHAHGRANFHPCHQCALRELHSPSDDGRSTCMTCQKRRRKGLSWGGATTNVQFISDRHSCTLVDVAAATMNSEASCQSFARPSGRSVRARRDGPRPLTR